MIKVGVTGGVGAGKTIVCQVFEKLGVPVFNSDQQAKLIVDSDELVKQAIINLLGNVYEQGKMNRAKVASIVFSNEESLKKLNAIIHPAVGKAYESFCEHYSHIPYTIKEAAILFETGINKKLDKVVVVAAEDEVRINRVMKRDNVKRDEVIARMNNQMLQQKKIELADYVIDNSGDELVLPQILALHNKFTHENS